MQMCFGLWGTSEILLIRDNDVEYDRQCEREEGKKVEHM